MNVKKIEYNYIITHNEFPTLSYGYYLMKALNFTKTQNSIQDYLLIQKSLLKLNITLFMQFS